MLLGTAGITTNPNGIVSAKYLKATGLAFAFREDAVFPGADFQAEVEAEYEVTARAEIRGKEALEYSRSSCWPLVVPIHSLRFLARSLGVFITGQSLEAARRFHRQSKGLD